MGEPVRIQRKRIAGWRMPPGAIYVGRPSGYGNYAAKRRGLTGVAAAIEFRRWIAEEASEAWKGRAAIDLRGRDLACWCGLCDLHQAGKPFNIVCPDCDPCHADPLGIIAQRLPIPRQ